jgi:predicted nucleotide-binding protein
MSELTNAQIQIAAEVVREFLATKKPTPRMPLFKIARSGEVLNELERWSILRRLDDSKYLPLPLAFHYCENDEALALAKESVKLMALLLKEMFENCDEENKQYYLADIQKAASERYGSVDAEKIWLGLYLGDGMNLCSKRGPQPWEITTVFINERIIGIENIDTVWDDFVEERTDWIRGQIYGFPKPSQADMPFEDNDDEERLPIQRSKKVFLVHGHDNTINETVTRFLQGLGLDVIKLQEQPNRGLTIIEKLEAHSGVGFTVVILTPDDVGGSAKEPHKTNQRARQNVIFELGLFIGKLGRNRVCPLFVGELEVPSDIHGLGYVRYDEAGNWRSQLLKEITAAGMQTSSAERGAAARTPQ